jgi:hypothetical protein
MQFFTLMLFVLSALLLLLLLVLLLVRNDRLCVCLPQAADTNVSAHLKISDFHAPRPASATVGAATGDD